MNYVKGQYHNDISFVGEKGSSLPREAFNFNSNCLCNSSFEKCTWLYTWPWLYNIYTIMFITQMIPVTYHHELENHYDGVIMGAIASQITSLTIVYSTVYSDADQRKHQSSASQAFVWGIHRGPVNSPHKWPVTLKMSPFDDVIMISHISGS